MPAKTHRANRHHIHTLSDVKELLRSQGHGVGVSYENDREAYAASLSLAPGRIFTPAPAVTVRLNKISGRLTVTRN